MQLTDEKRPTPRGICCTSAAMRQGDTAYVRPHERPPWWVRVTITRSEHSVAHAYRQH